MSSAAPDLYQRMRAYLAERRRPQVTVGTPEPTAPSEASQMSHARANVEDSFRPPLSTLSLTPISPLVRASDKRDTPQARLGSRGVQANPDQPRWCDLASTLFWLRHRDWPALDVDGVTIEGEAAWRAWVSRAPASVLLALRDRIADGGPTHSPGEGGDAPRYDR